MKQKICRFIICALKVKHIYDAAHIAAYSAQAAFFVIVSAVPVGMLGIIMLGKIQLFDLAGINGILHKIFRENISGRLGEMLAEIAQHSTVPVVSVTMLFLLWAATRGIRSIADGISVIYGSAEQYNVFVLTVRSVMFVGVLLADAVCMILVLFSYLKIRFALIFAQLMLLFSFAYHSLAKSRLSFKQQLGGGALAAGGWMVYSFGYSVYIRHFSKYPLLYGSFGAVMLFMLWLYMCMNILLCGALFNKLRAEKKYGRG